jgi:DNA-directed RNA polymerase specialized sigma24 family protein
MQPMTENGGLVETTQKRVKCRLGPEDVASMLAKLPSESKKVLAMHYHENMRLLDIATCLGVT